MRNFWILLKAQFINSFKLGTKKNKKKSTSSVALLVGLILIGILFLAIAFVYVALIAQMAHIAKNYSLLLKVGIGFGSLMTFIFTLTKAGGFLFGSKDYDLLMSLPVKPQSIVAVKVVNLILFNYVYSFFVYVPCVTFYAIYVHPGILFYLAALLIFFVLPLLVISVCSFFSYFIGMLLSKFKYKNVFKTIGLILVFLVIMYGSFKLQMSTLDDTAPTDEQIQMLVQYANGLDKIATKIYYPGLWATNGLEGNVLQLFGYIALMVIPFILFIYIVGKNFSSANASYRQTYTNKNFKLKDSEQKSQGQAGALIKKELKRYFASPNYIMNTIVGPLMGTIMMIIMVNQFAKQGVNIADSVSKLTIIGTAIGAIVFMNSISPTTASSISIEGKHFWIMKTAPLETKNVFMAKCFINLLITIPFALIDSVVAIIMFKLNVFDGLIIFTIPSLLCIFNTFLGLYVNISCPRFDWDNEMQVVKQGKSILITMLFGMLFAIITIGVIVLSMIFLNKLLLFLLGLLFTGGLALGMGFILFNSGKKRYERIQC